MRLTTLLVAFVMIWPLTSCTGKEQREHRPADADIGGANASPAEQQGHPPKPPRTSKRPTLVGAYAFVDHYFDLVTFALKTGNTGPMRKLAARSCTSCRAFQDNIDRLNSNGGMLRSQGWRIGRNPKASINADRIATFEVRLHAAAEHITSPDGATEVNEGRTVPVKVVAGYSGAAWSILEVSLLT